jgi:HAMP domain-containing protein
VTVSAIEASKYARDLASQSASRSPPARRADPRCEPRGTVEDTDADQRVRHSRRDLATRRPGSGDFSAPITAAGNYEFAALVVEFNTMSSQLERRLDELSQERIRLRKTMRRIGETVASNLDRSAPRIWR